MCSKLYTGSQARNFPPAQRTCIASSGPGVTQLFLRPFFQRVRAYVNIPVPFFCVFMGVCLCAHMRM